ncbi:pyridoxal-dependent decarboxylase [Radiomyces spectabilis]|uniref:pyridoxal-dependent decarboxylase n=1 Tax=Radiomyces spectabilis TaxID=64574 RepID=UPI00222049FC|nr:pyridoxal-dependent decarboxylase [Radiomyces spectabilis]KAI8388374.1 pyridoxal-dependent decarboxylase [Radiomyces spectabilis]
MHTEQLETVVLNQPCDAKVFKNPPSPELCVYNRPVRDIIKQKLDAITASKWETDQENAFFVGDLGEVYRQHLRWQALLPRIQPFFAVKSNPDPMVVKLLASLGLGFDCASKSEIQQVLDVCGDPTRIIYANPCKQASFIRYAAQQNVAKMTFDNAEELHKIKMLYPNAELVLRILTDDSKSLCQLGLKFGAPLDTVEHLLQTAKDLELNVIGVSFHVGSGCLDEHAFSDAVLRARRVFDQGQAMGFNFTLLDVGGGFPGADIQDGITFEKVAAVLGPAVDQLFPPEVRVIAEPGRYFVSSAFTICTHVIGRRTVQTEVDENASYMYYVNDGMYGSFNCILFDHQVVQPKVLRKGDTYMYGEKVESPEFTCSVWGPTCDSIDCLTNASRLPLLEEGDWMYWENMGAYTICAASQFNGFKKSDVVYTNTYC